MRLSKVLFVNPDYHNSRTLASGLRNTGIDARIWIPLTYNRNFLFKSEMNIFENSNFIYKWHEKIKGDKLFKKFLKRFLHVLLVTKKWIVFCKYTRLIVYGDLIFLNYFPESMFIKIYKKFFGKIYYVPSGCLYEAPKSWWANIESGSICSNCGYEPNCSEEDSNLNIVMANKHATKIVGFGFMNSPYLKQSHIKYKSFDFADRYWINEDKIQTKNFTKFLHSYSIDGRSVNGKNIKGTEVIKTTLENVSKYRHDLDFEIKTGINAESMRSYQDRFDVVIDQLHYGWWGSTTLEALSLGIPVMCHLKKEFIESFEQNFGISEEELPIINVSAQNLEERILEILNKPEVLAEYRAKIPSFLKKFLDIENNIWDFLEFIDLNQNISFPRELSFQWRVTARPLQDYIRRLQDINFEGLDKVVDFGCGYGQWSFALAELNESVVAVDINEDRLTSARKTAIRKGITNIDFVNLNEFDKKYMKHQFDGFFSYSVMHLMAEKDFFSIIDKALKRSGKFYVTGNSIGWYLMCLFNNPNASWDYSPRRMAALALLRNMFKLRSFNYKGEFHQITSDKKIQSMSKKFGLTIEISDIEGSKSDPSLRFFKSPYKRIEYVREYTGKKND